MPTYTEPTPKTNVGDLFRKQIDQLQEHNKTEEQGILNTGQPRWYRPADWDKSWLDIESMHAPFSREQQETEFVAVCKDTQAAGTNGDLSLVQMQGDWLHTMERAFRARMFNPVRGRIQCAGRKMGHGHEFGVLQAGMLGYVVNVDRLNKGETC